MPGEERPVASRELLNTCGRPVLTTPSVWYTRGLHSKLNHCGDNIRICVGVCLCEDGVKTAGIDINFTVKDALNN